MSARAPRGLYVYALADRSVRIRTRGIFGRPVRSIEVAGVSGLHAIVEPATRPPQQSIARIREQDRVLRALAVTRSASIVPARFGAFFPGQQELGEVVRQSGADLRRNLRLVRGCVQMTTRVFFQPDDPSPPARASSGTAHLLQLVRIERSRRTHPVVACVRRMVAPFVKAERVEWHDAGSVTAVSLFHLVPRTRLEPYVDALARACRDDRARVLVTGPFLPFAFAQGAW